jgi:uncharacterized protein YeaO (DUF488 family)
MDIENRSSPVCYASSREVRIEYRNEGSAEDKNEREDNASSSHFKIKAMKEIKLKRIYDDPSGDDGYRVLIDRLWPRGVSKEDAKLDAWEKELAPSSELRKWFDHKEKRFNEFSKRYREELKDKENGLEQLREIAKKKRLTLLYAAKDHEMNQAVVLKDVLLKV